MPDVHRNAMSKTETLSDSEHLMWNISRDPWMNPNGSGLLILDKPIDLDYFRHRMRWALTQLPRFTQRLVAPAHYSNPPRWVPDPDFSIDNHLSVVEAPGSGSDRDLFDLAATLYDEPLDTAHPLWRFVIINGLSGGRGAIWIMVHHVIGDGQGQVRLIEQFADLAAEPADKPDVDLEAHIAATCSSFGPVRSRHDPRELLAEVGRQTGENLTVSRRMAAEISLWPADPRRLIDKLGELGWLAESAIGPLLETNGGAGASLWQKRSGQRHVEHVAVPFDKLKAASSNAGATLNHAFMAAMVEASSRYHVERGVTPETVNASFIVSTRTGPATAAMGNAFTPVTAPICALPMSMSERVDAVRTSLDRAKAAAHSIGGVASLAGLAKRVHPTVMARVFRAQASTIDFATSNLPGWPGIALYIAGSRVTNVVVQGAVAGTPVNATALSGDNSFDIGLFIDPAAITEPEAFRDVLEDAVDQVLAL